MKSIICEASSIAKAIEQCWQKAGMPQNFSVKVLEKDEKNFLGMTKRPAKIALFFEDRPEPLKKRDTKDSRESRDNRENRGNKRTSEPDKLKYEKDKSLQENLKSLQEGTQKSIQKIQTQIKPQTQAKPQMQTKLQTQTGVQAQAKPQIKTQTQVRPVGKTQEQQVKTPEQVRPQAQIKTQAQVRPLGETKENINAQSQVRPVTQEQLLEQEKFIRTSPWTEEMVETSRQWVQGMLEKMNLPDVKFSVNVSSNNIRFHFDKSLVANKNEQKELFRNFAFLIMQTLRYKFKKQFRNLKAVFTCGA